MATRHPGSSHQLRLVVYAIIYESFNNIQTVGNFLSLDFWLPTSQDAIWRCCRAIHGIGWGWKPRGGWKCGTLGTVLVGLEAQGGQTRLSKNFFITFLSFSIFFFGVIIRNFSIFFFDVIICFRDRLVVEVVFLFFFSLCSFFLVRMASWLFSGFDGWFLTSIVPKQGWLSKLLLLESRLT